MLRNKQKVKGSGSSSSLEGKQDKYIIGSQTTLSLLNRKKRLDFLLLTNTFTQPTPSAVESTTRQRSIFTFLKLYKSEERTLLSVSIERWKGIAIDQKIYSSSPQRFLQ